MTTPTLATTANASLAAPEGAQRWLGTALRAKRPARSLRSLPPRGRNVGSGRPFANVMPDDAADHDLPLREDTRLLGRLLGDVVRVCNGSEISSASRASARRPSAFVAPTRRMRLPRGATSRAAQRPLHRKHAHRRARVLLLLASCEPGRGRASESPPPRACAGGLAAAARQPDRRARRLAEAGVTREAVAQWLARALVAPC